jgi:hypothetical protein
MRHRIHNVLLYLMRRNVRDSPCPAHTPEAVSHEAVPSTRSEEHGRRHG